MKKLTAIFWDYNGTLLDDGVLTIEAATKAFSQYDSSITFERVKAAQDVPTDKIIENLGINKDHYINTFRDKAMTIFHGHYKENLSALQLRKGVEKVLKYFESQKAEQHVLSNHPQNQLEEELNMLRVLSHFNHVIGRPSEDVSFKHATKPQRSAKIARHIDADHIVFIGDSPEEAHIARYVSEHTGKATTSIGVYGGLFNNDRLDNADPAYDKIVHEVSDIPDALNDMRLI